MAFGILYIDMIAQDIATPDSLTAEGRGGVQGLMFALFYNPVLSTLNGNKKEKSKIFNRELNFNKNRTMYACKSLNI